MHKILFNNNVIEVEDNSNLRSSIISAGLSPHNGKAKYLNCKGFGTCGTCAVAIEPDDRNLNSMEKWRLSFPPHKIENNLRLACQIKVNNDLNVIKFSGFWGHNINKSK